MLINPFPNRSLRLSSSRASLTASFLEYSDTPGTCVTNDLILQYTKTSPPKSAALRDAGFAALCDCAGMWLLLARVWLCEDLWLMSIPKGMCCTLVHRFSNGTTG